MFIYTCKEGSKVNSEERDFRGHWKVVVGTFMIIWTFKQFVCVRFDEGVPILKVLLYYISGFALENTTSPAYCIYLT